MQVSKFTFLFFLILCYQSCSKVTLILVTLRPWGLTSVLLLCFAYYHFWQRGVRGQGIQPWGPWSIRDPGKIWDNEWWILTFIIYLIEKWRLQKGGPGDLTVPRAKAGSRCTCLLPPGAYYWYSRWSPYQWKTNSIKQPLISNWLNR